MKSVIAIFGTLLFSWVGFFCLLIVLRVFMQVRVISSESMKPSLPYKCRVLLESACALTHSSYKRGEIIVFYPPPIELGGKDLSWDIATILGRATGLPFLPYEPAFVKRVIGIPGDRIQIESNKAVFVNGHQLSESKYIAEPACYNLKVLGDIGGQQAGGQVIRPYGARTTFGDPIIVPKGQYFVLGDNRNNSEDSHIFGFVEAGRVIGSAQLKYDGSFEIIERPNYPELKEVALTTRE